jgi:HlyD family secretion protein
LLKRLLLILIPVAVLAIWAFMKRSAPPAVPFARVVRETVENNLITNGKVEPIQWAAVRSEVAGTVARVLVQRGQTVKAGQVLVELDTREAQNELASANAKIAEARAELQTLTSGGRSTDRAEIESGLATARADLANARREYESVQRLAAKNAATRADVDAARDALDRAQLRIDALERRSRSLVSQPDRNVAEARIREAQATAASAELRIRMGQIRSPMDGVLYQFDVKVGAYLNPGDLVGMVGRIDQVRVIVYVDEPELGRVQKGMPVTITWTAMPGRQWKGVVEKVPSQVMALGTRQVGEVSCIIDNPDGTLLPGTNVDAEILSSVARNALTIPKEALRREGTQTGVLKLQDDHVVWQTVKVGITSVTKAQILEGLKEGDAVALPVDRPLKPGDKVKPYFP